MTFKLTRLYIKQTNKSKIKISIILNLGNDFLANQPKNHWLMTFQKDC